MRVAWAFLPSCINNGFGLIKNYGVAKPATPFFYGFVCERSLFRSVREDECAEVVHGHGYVIESEQAHLSGCRRDDERGRVVDLVQGEQSANDCKGVDKRRKQRQTTIKEPNGGGDK